MRLKKQRSPAEVPAPVDPLTALKQSTLFRGVDRRASRLLAEKAQWLSLPGGTLLYQSGDPGDAMFVLVNGRLRISRSGHGMQDTVLGEVAVGESAGEVAVITGEPRSADVLAMRDSGLLRIRKEAFEQVVRRYPDAMLAVARSIVQRQRRDDASEMRENRRNAHTYAVVAAHPGVDVREFAQTLADDLAVDGPTLRVDPGRVDDALGEGWAATPFEDSPAHTRLALWLNRMEDRYRYLVYQATSEPDAWSRRCLRQADRIIFVAHAEREPETSEMLAQFHASEFSAPVEVVLQQSDIAAEHSPLRWRERCGAQSHHLVGVESKEEDMARMARLISGRGLCLVLGGGGARGFAHIGLLRALSEKGVPVDAVGGTSMGAFVAAMVAMRMDYESMLETLRATFVENNYLNDYSLSRVSLISGKKFRHQLEQIFGETRIEDMRLPFFCVTTSLTHGRAVIHETGRLTDWVGTSMAVPGIAPPTVYRGELLVDGGLMHGVDFDTMMARGRGRVLFSDVSRANDLSLEGLAEEAPDSVINIDYKNRNLSIFKILFHSATLLNESKKSELAQRADLVLHMPVGDIGMFDWSELDNIAYRAYHYADEMLDRYLEKHPDLLTAG